MYYLDNFSDEECESSNIHPQELFRRAYHYDSIGCVEYRAVLSEEVYENMVYKYTTLRELAYDPLQISELHRPAYTIADKLERVIERYDILVQGKEIPAYYLGMVRNYGIVKVEPYTHLWGENHFLWFDAYMSKLAATRQY